MEDRISAFNTFDDAIKAGDVSLIADDDEQREQFLEHLDAAGWEFCIHMESYEVYVGPTGGKLHLMVDTYN